jgi:hypothetical protein
VVAGVEALVVDIEQRYYSCPICPECGNARLMTGNRYGCLNRKLGRIPRSLLRGFW